MTVVMTKYSFLACDTSFVGVGEISRSIVKQRNERGPIKRATACTANRCYMLPMRFFMRATHALGPSAALACVTFGRARGSRGSLRFTVRTRVNQLLNTHNGRGINGGRCDRNFRRRGLKESHTARQDSAATLWQHCNLELQRCWYIARCCCNVVGRLRQQ